MSHQRLALPFEPPDEPLRELALAADWREQRRFWGHAFHPMCSYLGSFPAALAHAFVARYSRPGDVVLDPFSGRGTLPLQACVERRIGVGVDANPLAWLLTAAKVDPPSRLAAEARLARLRIDWTADALHWRDRAAADRSGVFHPETLAALLYLRARLDRSERADRFLLAALAGILHGRTPGYLTDAMPNGLSFSPGSVARLRAGGAAAPERDVFRLLGTRLRRLFRAGLPAARGQALHADARMAGGLLGARLGALGHDRVRLVVTSPPYLHTIRYGAASWLRLWLLGEDAAQVDDRLDAPHGVTDYTTFLRDVLRGLRPALADDAVIVLILGDVATDLGRRRADRPLLAEAVWSEAAEPEGYRLAGVLTDPVPANRKVTRLWGREAGRATDLERILVIAPTELGRRRALASAGTPVDWEAPILGSHAADVPPRRPRLDGSAGPLEEPRPRADDQPASELRPATAGAPVRP